MIEYVSLFLIFSFLSIINIKKNSINFNFIWISSILFLMFFVGFRYQLGGDWVTYENIYQRFGQLNFWDNFKEPEIIFSLYYWLGNKLSLNFQYINLISAIFFYSFISKLCLAEKEPFTVLFLSFPLLILIVSIGFNRQSITIAILIYIISIWKQSNNIKIILSMIVAFLIHKAALVFFLLYLLKIKKIKFIHLLFASFLITLLYIFSYASLTIFIKAYPISNNFFSIGSLLRIFVLCFSSFLFFLFYKKFLNFKDYDLLKFFSISSFILLPLFFINSTIADRLGMYLYPAQIIIMSRVPIFYFPNNIYYLIKYFMIIFWFVILMVWLLLATNSHGWMPYNNYIFS